MKSATESEDVKEERIMTIKRIAISIAVLLMGGLFAATAEAEPIDLRIAGFATPTAIDTNGDGTNVSVATSQARGDPQGRAVVHAVTEFVLLVDADGMPIVPGPNCLSFPFLVQLDLLEGSTVSIGKDLSQWTGFYEGGFVCGAVTGTGEFTLDLDGIVNGGSGSFENATGTFHTSLSGRFVVPPGPGSQSFFTGTIVGIINGLDDDDDDGDD